MKNQLDVVLEDGRTLRGHDAGPDAGELAVLWHHGTPGLGDLPQPLLGVAAELDIRWFGYDRPGYGGSTRDEGRDVAAAGDDVRQLADALGIDRFATLGASGGATHALACAALLPERLLGVVSTAALAPFDAAGLDWFAGMYAGGEAELRAAVAGHDVLAAHLASTDFDADMFTPADFETLAGEWGWLGAVAGRALGGQPDGALDGMVDDDLAFVRPWGFDPAKVLAPTLIVHGRDDRVVPPPHGDWLASTVPDASLRSIEGAGHIAVMAHAADACRWLADVARR